MTRGMSYMQVNSGSGRVKKSEQKDSCKTEELRGPWGKDDRMSDRGGSREQRAGVRMQLWRSLASMQTQEGTPSSTYTFSRPRCR